MSARSIDDLVAVRSATVTTSKRPLIGVLELQTDAGLVTLALTQDAALSMLSGIERFLTEDRSDQ
jgi:hypothetical protein